MCLSVDDFCLPQPLGKKAIKAPTIRAQIVILSLRLSRDLKILDFHLMNK